MRERDIALDSREARERGAGFYARARFPLSGDSAMIVITLPPRGPRAFNPVALARAVHRFQQTAVPLNVQPWEAMTLEMLIEWHQWAGDCFAIMRTPRSCRKSELQALKAGPQFHVEAVRLLQKV